MQIITDYSTGAPRFKVIGGGGGGDSATAESMTTAERTAITPDAGVLIWDTDLEKLFVGDGSTAGGVEIGGGDYVAGEGITIAGGTITVNQFYASTSGNIYLKSSALNDRPGVFSAEASDVAANTEIVACSQCDIQKNQMIEFWADFTETFGTLEINHGKGWLSGAYLVIDSSKITLYDYNGNAESIKYYHGLTFSHFIHVQVFSKNSNSSNSIIRIMTDGGTYEAETDFHSCSGKISATASFALTRAKLAYSAIDAKQDVWVFGDSYLQVVLLERWPFWLMQDGYRNVLLCGLPGAGAAGEYPSFANLVSVATPKIAVWAPGMNTADTDSDTPNASWLAFTQLFIQECEKRGIVPVLATIPNTPTVLNVAKNNWVKASGYRYIDFADAVGATAASSPWYTGMLGADNVHPAIPGAQALYKRFLTDLPEAATGEETNTTPVVPITGATVVMYPGKAYSASVGLSTVSLGAYVGPDGALCEDAHLSVTIGDYASYLSTFSNVILMDKLFTNATNNCVVKFRNGNAYVYVEDFISGYLVVNSSSSGVGSLNYALSSSTESSVTFRPLMDGTVLDLGGAVTNGTKHIVGNGYTQTIVSGGVACTSNTTFTNMGLNNVSVLSGSMTLGDVEIVSGGSVIADGGTFILEHVRGGGTINLNSTTFVVPVAYGATISGCTVVSGAPVISGQNRSVIFDQCSFVNNTYASRGGILNILVSFDAKMNGCIVSGNTAEENDFAYLFGGTGDPAVFLTLSGCTIGANQNIALRNTGAQLKLEGSNYFGGMVHAVGANASQLTATVLISSGAIVDLTGNTIATPIAPGGGVIVDGGCTVINSAGASVSITGGTYTKINNDGTTA